MAEEGLIDASSLQLARYRLTLIEVCPISAVGRSDDAVSMLRDPAGVSSARRAAVMGTAKIRERRQSLGDSRASMSRARPCPRDKQLLSITHSIPPAQVTHCSRHVWPSRNGSRLA
jgi:hypothetical protein